MRRLQTEFADLHKANSHFLSCTLDWPFYACVLFVFRAVLAAAPGLERLHALEGGRHVTRPGESSISVSAHLL